MYIPNRKLSEETKRCYAMQDAARGPKILTPGVHTYQIRTMPADVGTELEAFYAKMQAKYNDFTVLYVNTNMTVSAMYAYVTYSVGSYKG